MFKKINTYFSYLQSKILPTKKKPNLTLIKKFSKVN